MTNILIPTDFTPASLKPAELAIKSLESGRVNIILFHAFSMPFFIPDMLGSRIQEPYQELINDDLRQACRQIKEAYSKKVDKIVFRFMTGDTTALFRNFIDANDIDIIICADNYYYNKIHPRSVNPLPLFKKAGIPVLKDLMPGKTEIIFKLRPVANPQLLMN